jgi:hypothetical protein
MTQYPQNRLNPRKTALALGCLGIAALGFAVALRLWQSYGAREPFVDLVKVAEQLVIEMLMLTAIREAGEVEVLATSLKVEHREEEE